MEFENGDVIWRFRAIKHPAVSTGTVNGGTMVEIADCLQLRENQYSSAKLSHFAFSGAKRYIVRVLQ